MKAARASSRGAVTITVREIVAGVHRTELNIYRLNVASHVSSSLASMSPVPV